MSPRWLNARIWTLVGALLVLTGVNWAWAGKTRIVNDGRELFISLAPIDPRSLMQGDYMDLRFGLREEIERARENAPAPSDPQGGAYEGAFGRAPIALDERGVARLDWNTPTPTLVIRYRLRRGDVWLGTRAFFFEEGAAKRYEPARFGVFRVDADSGEAVLVGLADAELQRL
jgi:uncharacterized membrane-anchored protein